MEKEMASHFSILAWKIPWTEEPAGYSPGVAEELDTRLSRWTTTTLKEPVKQPFHMKVTVSFLEGLSAAESSLEPRQEGIAVALSSDTSWGWPPVPGPPPRPTPPCHLQWWGDLRSPPSPRLPLKGPPAPTQVQPGHSEPGKAAEGQPRDRAAELAAVKTLHSEGGFEDQLKKEATFPSEGDADVCPSLTSARHHLHLL